MRAGRARKFRPVHTCIVEALHRFVSNSWTSLSCHVMQWLLIYVQNETALEISGRGRSLWVLQRLKSAAISRGLDKTASLFERTVNNPVFYVLCSISPVIILCNSDYHTV